MMPPTNTTITMTTTAITDNTLTPELTLKLPSSVDTDPVDPVVIAVVAVVIAVVIAVVFTIPLCTEKQIYKLISVVNAFDNQVILLLLILLSLLLLLNCYYYYETIIIIINSFKNAVLRANSTEKQYTRKTQYNITRP